MISVSHTPYDHRYLDDSVKSAQQPLLDLPASSPSRKLPSVDQSQTSASPAFTLESINSLPAGALPSGTMQAETWGNLAQYNPEKLGRLPHQRESSLSSLGSTGPASPYTQNTSNPQIAVTDSVGDELSDIHAQDPGNQNASFYQLTKPSANTYTGYQQLDQTLPEMAYPVAISGPSTKPRSDRGLLPAPELSGSASRSYPTSVASSVAGDSPATPTVGSDQDCSDKRRKGEFFFVLPNAAIADIYRVTDANGNIPKLDRTMTDIYGDELYSPNFTITSTPPSQAQQLSTVSPPNDIFNQRINAANSQHLNVSHPQANSIPPTDRSSPFRSSSPFAQSVNQDFAAPSQSRLFNNPQRLRETSIAQHDAQLFRQQMVPGTEPETPKTISPKDAIIEFNDQEGETDFPLFPQNPTGLDMDHLAKMMPPQPPAQQFLPDAANALAAEQFNYLPSQVPTGIQVPQQYPFVARMEPNSNTSPPRLSSSASSDSNGATTANLMRPMGTAADGGTYTCTYHGCTLRFETPALLQKHKREGHRQSHGLAAARPQDINLTSGVLNTQAGPHRCDRINPSTGKSCNTVFSRPYDLTRHEDTIHNARKQKVRCDLCTEEKTFSRADALTRHYRVCHPDMELPGKHRRRGGG